MTKNGNLMDIRKPNLRQVEHNKTTLFMLPAINLSSERTGYKLLKYFGLVNCYLGHKQSLESNPNYLFLVFNPTNEAMKKYWEFYEIYRTYPNYVTDYVVDFNLIVVVFRVRDKWRSTLDAFKASRYSKMSKEYAELFKRPNLETGKVAITNEYFIIHKHKEYKKHLEDDLATTIDDTAELASPLEDEHEYFDYQMSENEQVTKV